ncbi:MAG: hypothetical protein ACE5F1_15760 [Planctomycetota bacterium]
MRPLLAPCVVALSGALWAQTIDQNRFANWDKTTEFTSRARVGTGKGHISLGFPYGHFGGIQSLTFANFIIQDQNLATREPWSLGYCFADAAGAPDYANNKVILANQLLPGGSGVGAFSVTLNLNTTATKVALNPPAKDIWNWTWEFVNAAPNWTSDGISIHMSQAATYNGTLLCFQGSRHREIPRTDASWDGTNMSAGRQILEHMAWSAVPGGNPPISSMERSWRLDLGSDEATLQTRSDNSVYNGPGCPNPNPGFAGRDPDFNDSGGGTPGRFDNPSWEIRGGPSFANGVGVIVNSMGVLNPGLKLPGINGALQLDFLDPLFAFLFIVPLNGAGNGTFTQSLGPNSSAVRKAVESLPNWTSQAYLVGTGAAPKREFSNIASMRPKLSPGPATARFIMAQTVRGTPLNLTRSRTQTSIYVRNDGPRWDKATASTIGGWGEIDVQQFAGSRQIGPTVTVPARAGMRIPISVVATLVRVSGKKSVPTTISYLFNF